MDGTSSTVVGEFRYTPLPSASFTRFLELLPATDPSNELRCNLRVVDLEKDCNPYEALSYTWGDGSPTHQIYISILDGSEESWAALPITENLWAALRRFRRRSKVRVIWADAVCINQEDVEEKEFQIPGMVDIYRCAERVLVWLGSDGDKEKAMARLRVLGHRIVRRESTLSAGEMDELASCASALLSMPWFSRRWIIQEVVFSPHAVLFVGAESTSFLRLVSIINKLLPLSRDPLPTRSTEAFLAMYQIWNQTLSGEPSADCGLLRLMRVFDHFGCVDPVDRIFTIAPLAHDVELKLLPTSASRNRKLKLFVRPLPTTSSPYVPPTPGGGSVAQLRGMELSYGAAPEQVFTCFAEFLAHSDCFVWALGQALARADGAARPSGLPSWVPDWRNPRRRQPLWIERRGHRGLSTSFNEANPCEKLLTRYDDGLIYRNEVPPWPAIARRSDGNGHRLRAAVCHTEYWPSTLDQCVEDPDTEMLRILEKDYCDQMRTIVMPLRHDMLFPLSVDFKTKPFPGQYDPLGVVEWIRESFLSLLSHVLPPWQLSIFMAAETGPKRWSGLPGRYLERFAFVITAGGMFTPGFSGAEQASLVFPTNSMSTVDEGKDGRTHIQPGSSDPYPGTGSDDPDLRSEDWPDPDKLGFSPLDPASLVPVLAPIIDNSKGDEPPTTLLLRLISTTMTGRCVITCDYVIPNGAYLQPELDSDTMRVLGITSPHTARRDKIMSLHDAFEDGHKLDCYSWRPSQEQGWRTAPRAVQSDGSVSGGSEYLSSWTKISFHLRRPPQQKYWTRTYAVRPQGPQAEEGEGAKQRVWFDRPTYLCCRFDIPRLEFVGDCFLSTLRWEPDLLRPRGFCVVEIWDDLLRRWCHRVPDPPPYKTANLSASILEFHLV